MLSKITIKFFVFLFALIGFQEHLRSQEDSSAAFPFIRFQYSYMMPGGSYEETFGATNLVGGAFCYKTRSNWQFELEGNYFFGTDNKRQNLLTDIINKNGDVVDLDGELVKVIYDIRAFSFFTSVGKVIPIFGGSPNSGLLIQAGIGYLQHRIKIDFRDGEVFQLSDEMLKGYDRLHTGIAFKQFIGYQYFGKSNLINFYVGLELNQGLTYNRREFNYDTQEFDRDQKLDLLSGLRLGWSIPIRSRASEEFYYY